MKSKLNNYEIDILLGLVYDAITMYNEMAMDTKVLWSIESKLYGQYKNNKRRKK